MVRLENVRKTEESRGEPRTRTLHDSTNILGPRKSKGMSWEVISLPEKKFFGGRFFENFENHKFSRGGSSQKISKISPIFLKKIET